MDSNRVRVALTRESTLGSTPGSARLRPARIVSEGLNYQPVFFTPAEIRSDRMSVDPTKVNETIGGTLNFELSYPVDGSALSELYQSAMFNLWSNSPQRDNDGTAASVITSVTTGTNVIAVTTGTAFAIGHLIRTTGFGQAANNGINRVTTGGTTSITCSGASYATEASPAAAARVKVVGFAGVSGDITATATGLGATTLNFTTLGLSVGQWIKIGGTATSDKFATAALNGWARITAIAATALTLDNLPTGWTTDTGTGKTIKVWFGDTIKNGTTMVSASIEKAFLDLTAPVYMIHRGEVVDQLNHRIETGAAITGDVSFVGMNAAQGTVAYGATYDSPTTAAVLTGNVSVGQINEAGSSIVSPNWARSLTFSISNNVRRIDAVGNIGAVTLGVGEIDTRGTIATYFGSNALLTKLLAGTLSSLSCRASANSQAIVWQFPRVTFKDGTPNAGGKSQDVMLSLGWEASYDSTTNAEVIFDRLEYFET